MTREDAPEALQWSKRRLLSQYRWFDYEECRWVSRDGVKGAGIGTFEGAPCIQVYINLEEGTGGTVPSSFHGWPVRLLLGGPIIAL